MEKTQHLVEGAWILGKHYREYFNVKQKLKTKGAFSDIFTGLDVNNRTVIFKCLKAGNQMHKYNQREMFVSFELVGVENVARIHDIVDVFLDGSKRVCLIMEFCHGGDLHAYFASRKPFKRLSMAECRYVFKQLIKGYN